MTQRGRLVIAITITAVIIGVAVVSSLLAAVRSGGGRDAALAALAADPLAAHTHAGARLTFAYDRSAKPGGVLAGKPVSTQLLRGFVPDTGNDLAALQLELTNLADRSGWAMGKVTNGSVQGSKPFNFGEGEIVIGINQFTSPPSVTVALIPLTFTSHSPG